LRAQCKEADEALNALKTERDTKVCLTLFFDKFDSEIVQVETHEELKAEKGQLQKNIQSVEMRIQVNKFPIPSEENDAYSLSDRKLKVASTNGKARRRRVATRWMKQRPANQRTGQATVYWNPLHVRAKVEKLQDSM
jgi:hypothetical protein